MKKKLLGLVLAFLGSTTTAQDTAAVMPEGIKTELSYSASGAGAGAGTKKRFKTAKELAEKKRKHLRRIQKRSRAINYKHNGTA